MLFVGGLVVALGAAADANYDELETCESPDQDFQDSSCFLQDTSRVSLRAVRQPAQLLSVEEAVDDSRSDSAPWPRLKQSLSQFLVTNFDFGVRPTIPSHPFPSLDWSDVKYPSALICAITLFCAGVLCSAGGIGGGGVYVTVLMVAGSLSPHDAVPLSKSVVFFGSLSSLVLNLKKSLTPPANGGVAKVLIDYNICRLVVPSALFGTLMGVLLNSMVAPWAIVAMLAAILCMMTWMSCREFYKHYTTEGDVATNEETPSTAGNNDYAPSGGTATTEQPFPQQDKLLSSKKTGEESIRGILCPGEGVGAFILLLLIICSGALRAHAAACQDDLVGDPTDKWGRDACERPIIKSIFGENLKTWAQPNNTIADIMLYGTVFVPATTCAAIVMGYSAYLARREGWLMKHIAAYVFMATATGCFAGLVGIGGGLVFSPFILWMSDDPAVAVATSSTLVIFTSSSTTFQYLFTDRITMALTLVYGMVNLAASYVGTSTVHMLDEKANRKTCISGIVCLGVIASVTLSVFKLCTMGVAH